MALLQLLDLHLNADVIGLIENFLTLSDIQFISGTLAAPLWLYAASHGYLELLRDIVGRDTLHCRESIADVAARESIADVAAVESQWIVWDPSRIHCRDSVAFVAAVENRFAVVEWISSAAYDSLMGPMLWPWGCQRIVWDPILTNILTNSGSLKMLQLVIKNGCEWHPSTTSTAAFAGELEILKWAVANGCPWDSHTSCSAVMGGDLELLEWAVKNGCPWHMNTPLSAVVMGLLPQVTLIKGTITEHVTHAILSE